MGRPRVLVGLGLGLLVAGLALSAVVANVGGDGGAEAWAALQDEFASENVRSVELWAAGPKKAIFAGHDAQAYANALFSASFDSTNADNEGPTAEVVVLLHYDGREQPLTPNQWPDGRFELTWKGVQFLVRSPELARLLGEAGFVY